MRQKQDKIVRSDVSLEPEHQQFRDFLLYETVEIDGQRLEYLQNISISELPQMNGNLSYLLTYAHISI